MADDNWDDIYDEIVKQLLADAKTYTNKALYNKTAAILMDAIFKGLNGNDFSQDDSRHELLKAFKSNVEAFSYAKTLTQFKHFKDLMFDEKGTVLSATALKKVVANQGEAFNNRYLNVEHQFATQSAIMAHKWQTMNSEFLEFRTVGDGRVRPEHKLFDKFTARKSDPIWKRLYAPLSWNCRCTVIPGVEKNVSKEYNSDWANNVVDPLVKNTIFDNNVGISYEIFTKKHPYFKAVKNNDNYHLHKNEDFSNNLEKLSRFGFDKVYPKIPVENINSINLYTKQFYADINKFNRGVDFYINHTTGHTKEYYKAITNAINKGLDLIPDKFIGTIYRGTDLKEVDFNRYKVAFETKKPIVEKGFISSSYDKDSCFSGSHNFIIKSKKGTIIEKISAHGTIQKEMGGISEKEVLFKAGQKFKVTNIVEIAKGEYIIYMEEI